VELQDFDGACQITRVEDLLSRLRTVRRGPDGAFVLDHGGDESLWVHIHGDAAFLCFFPDKEGGHPGFVPDGMWSGEKQDVRFLLVDGFEADAIQINWRQLVPLEVAFRAAVEFLHSPELPPSVSWLELGEPRTRTHARSPARTDDSDQDHAAG
jgi:hypothetical protein